MVIITFTGIGVPLLDARIIDVPATAIGRGTHMNSSHTHTVPSGAYNHSPHAPATNHGLRVSASLPGYAGGRGGDSPSRPHTWLAALLTWERMRARAAATSSPLAAVAGAGGGGRGAGDAAIGSKDGDMGSNA